MKKLCSDAVPGKRHADVPRGSRMRPRLSMIWGIALLAITLTVAYPVGADLPAPRTAASTPPAPGVADSFPSNPPAPAPMPVGRSVAPTPGAAGSPISSVNIPQGRDTGVPIVKPTASSTPVVSVSSSANDAIRPWSAGYTVGNNYGYQDGWTNADYGDLSVAIGQMTTRYSLPKDYVKQYGIAVERPYLDHMKQIGMHDLVCFLSPRVDGTYPIPTDLYAPIWSSPGVVNPANSWAKYVESVVKEYGDIIKVWEVWNEPDITNNWQLGTVGGAWETRQPRASELPNWHGTLMQYVRIMRITYEVVHAFQSDGYVATGGITYEAWLDWILRLTDNPTDGSATAQYPLTGGAYFDVLSFHEYPIYAEQDWIAHQKDVFLPTGTTQNDLANWAQKVKNLKYVLAQRGYDGSRYPAKIFLTTETGVPWQVAVDPSSGAPVDPTAEAQRAADTAVGQIALMRALGVMQVHFYQLNDSWRPGTGLDDGFNHMGMYQYLTTPSQTQSLTPIGAAVRSARP